MLEMRLFLALLQMTFFFEAIPEELDGSEASEVVTVHPTKSYVRPIPWAEQTCGSLIFV
jgi:hypothetical protein